MSIDRDPTVSVVVPFFNNPNSALRAIASILRQTSPAHEVIVVDDASALVKRASLMEVIDRWCSPVPIRVEVLQSNVGPGLARHAGATLATGAYVAFLDSDDLWHPRKLEITKSLILRTGASLLGHRRPWLLNRSESKSLTVPSMPTVKRLGRRLFLLKNPIPTSSIVVEHRIAQSMFRRPLRKAEDFVALIDAISRVGTALFIEADLCWAEKPPFGHSGEGSDQAQMYLASFRGMLSVYREGLVAWPELLLFTVVLVAKFPIGLLRSWRYQLLYGQNRLKNG